jgi:hypothetical protein
MTRRELRYSGCLGVVLVMEVMAPFIVYIRLWCNGGGSLKRAEAPKSVA